MPIDMSRHIEVWTPTVRQKAIDKEQKYLQSIFDYAFSNPNKADVKADSIKQQQKYFRYTFMSTREVEQGTLVVLKNQSFSIPITVLIPKHFDTPPKDVMHTVIDPNNPTEMERIELGRHVLNHHSVLYEYVGADSAHPFMDVYLARFTYGFLEGNHHHIILVPKGLKLNKDRLPNLNPEGTWHKITYHKFIKHSFK